MKKLILVLLIFGGCGSADQCASYCNTSCNKAAFCDPYFIWSNADVMICENSCIETIDQASIGFGKKADGGICAEFEEEIQNETCEQFNSFTAKHGKRITQ